MLTVTGTAHATGTARSSPLRRTAIALAGPALIVVSVLVALRGIAFLPRLTDQHPDVLSFWLPRSCLLGRSIAQGHVPLWNPFEMIGTPFAADSQSGWLSLTGIGTSWLFGCGGGLRAQIVLHPILAGLGLWWFLRREGLGRIASTMGGLSLSMAIAASIIAISLPFAGTLAWTPFVLVGASGWFCATGWRRFGWLALGAFAWGQVAAAHLSHGLVLAPGLTAVYLVARALHEVHAGRLSGGRALWLGVAFLVFLPLANLAIILPRFALLDRSSLGQGYEVFEGTVAGIGGADDLPIMPGGIWAAWPLALASAPGGYLGAATLLLVPFAFRDRARRFLVVALSTVALGAYLLTASLLLGASWFRELVLALPFGDVLLHNPSRFRYTAFLVLPALGAIGVQSLLDRRPAFAEAIRWLAIGLAVLLAFPLLAGADPGRLVAFTLAAVAVIVVVRAIVLGRRWAPAALAGVLTFELLAGALWSSTYAGGTVYFGLEGEDHPALVAGPLRWPEVDLNDYLEPGPIARALGERDGRYLSWIQPDAAFNKGYLFTRARADWPALLIGRSVLFEVDDVLGYSPIQLARYWRYIRATNDLPVFYNASTMQLPRLEDLRLLGVRYLIGRTEQHLPPGIGGTTVATEGGYRLVEVEGAQPRASVVTAWEVVADEATALERVLEPGFDPEDVAILEADPQIDPTEPDAPVSTSVTYTQDDPETALVSVDSTVPAIVVLRTAWDEGWTATVDGAPSPVLHADHLLQGVAVTAGSHQIRLVYREPALGRGLLLSGLAWVGFVVAFGVALARRRQPSEAGAAGSTGA
jgi:hypothetical protein